MKAWSLFDRPHFDKDAAIYIAGKFANRWGRFYDVPHFVDRIIKNLNKLKLSLFFITNEKEVHQTVTTKFVALFEKTT